MRRVSLSVAAVSAWHLTVYVTSRKPGLAPGATMAGIAADYAKAIEEDLGEPAAFHGTSAGGAVGLQLAIGDPHLVRRLVLAAAACRRPPAGCHRPAISCWPRSRDRSRQETRGAHRRWWPRRWHPGPCATRPPRCPGWPIRWGQATPPIC
jgi:pimeloyl-ACP methyl ester carboxylesterase